MMGKRTPPFLRNDPDENLVRPVELGRLRTGRYTKRERCRRVSATRKIDCEAYQITISRFLSYGR